MQGALAYAKDSRRGSLIILCMFQRETDVGFLDFFNRAADGNSKMPFRFGPVELIRRGS